MLSTKEIQILHNSVHKLDAGVYELKDILGDQWYLIKSPTTFGKSFKKFVLDGGFKEIEFIDIKTNNHNTYEIKK